MKKSIKYWICVAIGLAFMLLFPLLPPVEPMTEVGMAVIGVFIGMVFMWSTVDGIWPELIGLIIIALHGYIEGATGYAAVKTVFAGAFSGETVLTIMFGMLFFGCLEHTGVTKYIARFFLRKKAMEGRPYVLLFVFLMCSYVLSGLSAAMVSMFLLWPVALEICEKFHYKKGDKFLYVIICGIYFASTIGQPMLPFKGAILAVLNAFGKAFGVTINTFSYLLFNIIMAVLVFLGYLLVVRFLIRPDMTALKAITVDDVMKDELPPMNFRQKAVSILTAASLVIMVLPSILPASFPLVSLLNSIGLIGQLCVFIALALLLRDEKQKPLINLKEYARTSFSWDIYFQVAGALYLANAITSDATGIKPFIVKVLNPLLGGGSAIVFVVVMITMAILITNVANNMAMGIVFMSILAAFAEEYAGVNMTALAVTVAMGVFIALLTPAASPYCGMLHARKDLVDTSEILKVFVPMVVVAAVLYIVVGYPLATLLFR